MERKWIALTFTLSLSVTFVVPINIYNHPLTLVFPNYSIVNNERFFDYFNAIILDNPVPQMGALRDRDLIIMNRDEEILAKEMQTQNLGNSLANLEAQLNGLPT